MDPFFTRNRMSDYLDGTLSAKAKSEFEETIANNPELADELRALKATRNLLQNHGEVEPPPELFDAIMDHVDKSKTENRWWVPVAKYGLLAAAATLAVVVWSKQDNSLLSEETVDAGGVVSRQPLTKQAKAEAPSPEESNETIKTPKPTPEPSPTNTERRQVRQSRHMASFEPPVNPDELLKTDIDAPPKQEVVSTLSKENNLGNHLHLVSNDSNPKTVETSSDDNEGMDEVVVGNRINTNDPMILNKIHELKSNYSNLKVLKRNGERFQPYSMSEDAHYRALKLIAPTSEWDALKESLMAHGAEMIQLTNKRNKNGQTVAEAEIEILFEDEQ